MDLYGLPSLRRLKAAFTVDTNGCFNFTLCATDEFVSGTDIHDQDFTGWTVGAGAEKRLGNTSIRGELSYTDYGASERTVPYDALAITVPLRLEAAAVGARVSLLWHF